MSQSLLEKHEKLVVELAKQYVDNMEVQLGKKYKNNQHEINARLSEIQQATLKDKHNISSNEFLELYSKFLNMQPTDHFNQVMEAFIRSGGNVDIEPAFDSDSQRLKVAVQFAIKETTLEKIEGLTPIEDLFLTMNAMLQVESVLNDTDENSRPF
ncbi:MAG: hypothetical protein P8Y20_05275 [Gammaproteobacteria bacterium]|jgi:hypothetical protein